MVDLTISIVNHNSVEPLRTCLESILSNVRDMTYQIYVVDNLCEEQAASILTQEFPQVKVVSNSQTLGFGANHNQILRLAIGSSKYVLVLNPDTILPPDSIQTMIDFLHSNQTVAVCSPNLRSENGLWTSLPKQAIKLHRDALLKAFYISNATTLFRWFERLRNLKPRNNVPVVKTSFYVTNPGASSFDAQFCEVILGACMLFVAEALRDVGLFDERFFLYFEEYDWCIRARQHGWKVCLLRNVEIIHNKGYSTVRTDYLRYLQISTESMLKFYQKHDGVWSERILRTWLTCVATLNIARWSILYPLQPYKRNELVAWRAFSVKLIKGIWRI